MRVAAGNVKSQRSILIAPTVLAMALLSPLEVRACIDLPDAEIRQLDYFRMKDPSEAERIARTRLAQSSALTAEQRVQYDIVIAFAAGNEGRGKDARAALDAAAVELENVPAGHANRALLSESIAEAEYGAAHTPAEFQNSLARIENAIRAVDPSTADGTCLLLSRGLVEIALDHLDRGVADEIAAYRTARAHHWERAAAIAANGLTTIYLRTGMYAEAEQMNEETIRYATANDFTGWLSTAIYRNGGILAAQHRWTAALEAFEKAQRMSLEQGDDHGAAELRVPICNGLIDSGQIAAAAQRCRGDAVLFDNMRRPDLAAAARLNDARLAHMHGRYAESLQIINEVIGHHLSDIHARHHPELFRQRAASSAALGHFADAYRDIATSMNLAGALSQSEKIRIVAVQTGRAMARELEDANRLLAEDNTLQRSLMERNRAKLRLGIGLAVAGLLLSGMLATLFIRESRHRRTLSRQTRILRTLTDNLADSIMLLDGSNLVVFANRAITKPIDSIEGKNLCEVVPDESRHQFLEAIAGASRDRRTIDFDATWHTGDGAVRFLEQRVSPVLEGSEVIGLTVRSSDVTEKRVAERVLKMQSRVLETMKEGVMVIDASGQIIFGNDAMCFALGYPVGELRGCRVDNLTTGLRHLPESVNSLEQDERTQFEIVVRARDGTEHLMAITSSALITENGVAAVCVCHDITTQRLIERALAVAGIQEAGDVGVTLHEGLAQDLAGIAMLSAAALRTPDTNHGEHDDSGLSRYLADAVARARTLGGRMSPLAAAGGSLSVALKALCGTAGESAGTHIGCAFEPPNIVLARIVGDQVYRLADDMIGYVSECYVCDSLSLVVVQRETKLFLTLEWTGIERASRSQEVARLARETIAYRCKLLGGGCDFSGSTDQAHSVVVSVPLEREIEESDRAGAPVGTARPSERGVVDGLRD